MQSLERRLGPTSVTIISISSMIGSGIFVLPGIGIAATGPSLFIAFALSALVILPAAMGKAELATAMPTSGGTYVYIERTFGPLCGTVAGFGLFLSILLKASFALVGLGAYFVMISSFPFYPTILAFLTIIVALNILGVGKVSSFLGFFLGLTILGLLVLIAFSVPHWNLSYMQPLMPQGHQGLANATALVFVSFAGVTKVAAIAGEVKTPEKNLPLGILLSLFIVTLIYCGVAFTLSVVFSPQEMANEIRPIYILAERVGPKYFALLIAIIAVITMVNTSNSGVLAASRFPFAMGKDRLLPSFLGRLNRKFLTPIASILFSGALIAFMLLTMNVAKMAKLASAFMILIYLVENICVLVLRETRPQWYNPSYKAPWYPFLQLLGIASTLALLYFMGHLAVVAILSIAIPGVIFYFTYSINRTSRRGVVGIRSKRTDFIEERPRFQLDDLYQIKRRAQVVVGLFGKERSADMLVEMGVALAEHGHVEVASLIEIPEQTTPKDIVEEPKQIQSLRRRVGALAKDRNKEIHLDSVVTHDLAKAIYQIGQCVHCHWLLIEWRGKARGALTIHDPVGWLKSHLHCHLATYKDAGIRYIKNLLVLLNGDRNDNIVLETAKHLATVYRANITLVRWVPKKMSKQDQEWNLKGMEHVIDTVYSHSSARSQLKIRPLLGEDLVQSVVDETIGYDLLILGGQNHSLFNSFFGAMDDRIIEKAACSVMAVHASS